MAEPRKPLTDTEAVEQARRGRPDPTNCAEFALAQIADELVRIRRLLERSPQVHPEPR
jgi:hypothetical protein